MGRLAWLAEALEAVETCHGFDSLNRRGQGSNAELVGKYYEHSGKNDLDGLEELRTEASTYAEILASQDWFGRYQNNP